MRRKDREITNINDILSIINDSKVIRIAMSVEDIPYIVPLNFGYCFKDNIYEFYCHCANSGKKLDMIKNNSNVAILIDTSHCLTEATKACEYSYNYRSIMGNGCATIVEDISDKKLYLSRIMEHQTGENFTFLDNQVSGVAIIKIEVTNISAKAKM